jgi:ATP-dependent Clp protease protease subunit
MGLIFVRGRLDDALASSVIAQLLMAAQLATRDSIDVYIDSPGGSIRAALGVYDFIQSLGARVSTTCSGTAGGSAVLILAGGAAARRAALPSARIHLTDDPVDLSPGRFDDPEAQAEEARRATARWRSALLQRSSQSPEQLAQDMAAGRWLSATEALDYGLIDRVGLSSS